MKRILLMILTLAVCLPILSGCSQQNLDENSIKRISVTSLPKGYEYSFKGDDAQAIIDYLECERVKFCEDKTNKQAWINMIQILPTSYNQMRTVTLNYENLINIYYARRTHKLDEWKHFCDWIMSLPYAKELIAVKKEGT